MDASSSAFVAIETGRNVQPVFGGIKKVLSALWCKPGLWVLVRHNSHNLMAIEHAKGSSGEKADRPMCRRLSKRAREPCDEKPFKAALGNYKASNLPLNRGLRVVRIMGCFPTDSFESSLDKIAFLADRKPHANEFHFGAFAESRYLWLAEYMGPLENSGSVSGAFGLSEWAISRQEHWKNAFLAGRAQL